MLAAIATATSPSPMLAVVGLYNDGTGLVLVAALVAAWALGRRQSGARERAAGRARLRGRRPPESPGGPNRPRSARGLPGAAALFASGVQLSGGRTGLLLLGLVGLWELVRSRWRVAVMLAAAAVVGVLLASALFASAGGASDRLAQSDSSGLSGRIDRWALAIPAVTDRPVLGIGPGLYRRATSVHDTVAAAEAFGAETLNRDGHNLFVEYVVTTGILGVVALAAWLLLAGLGARGELAAFVVFAAVSLLLQPQFVGLTPVLALALGAAAPDPDRARRIPRVGRALAWTGAIVGLVIGALLVRGDLEYDRAVSERSATVAHRAVALLPLWPDPAEFEATTDEARARTQPAALARAVLAARVAQRRDPSSPGPWLLIAQTRAGTRPPANGDACVRAGAALEPAVDRRARRPRPPRRRAGRHRAGTDAVRPLPGAVGLAVPAPPVDQRGGRRHSAIARSASTATTPVPSAPMTAPTTAPIAVEAPQSPWQPMSLTP